MFFQTLTIYSKFKTDNLAVVGYCQRGDLRRVKQKNRARVAESFFIGLKHAFRGFGVGLGGGNWERFPLGHRGKHREYGLRWPFRVFFDKSRQGKTPRFFGVI